MMTHGEVEAPTFTMSAASDIVNGNRVRYPLEPDTRMVIHPKCWNESETRKWCAAGPAGPDLWPEPRGGPLQRLLRRSSDHRPTM